VKLTFTILSKKQDKRNWSYQWTNITIHVCSTRVYILSKFSIWIRKTTL